MSELPDRPNLDQLRRQARELLRAAGAGEPAAAGRIRAVSAERTLSAAQLAIAREYGFSSWPALHAEVGRRRLAAPAEAAGLPAGVPAGLRPRRRSLGGTAVIEAAAGTLSFSMVIAGADHAFADAWLQMSAGTERQLAGPPGPRVPGARLLRGALATLARRQPHRPGPEFGDVTVSDDQGRPHALTVQATAGPRADPRGRRGLWLRLLLDPVPPPQCSWISLHGPGGPEIRLQASPRRQVRVAAPAPAAGTDADRELTRLALDLIRSRLGTSGPAAGGGQFLAGECAAVRGRAAELRDAGRLSPAGGDLPGQIGRLAGVLTRGEPAGELPAGWAGMLGAAGAADGPARSFDLAAYVPAPGGIGVQLDTLISEPGRWQVYLRAVPGWREASADRQQIRNVLFVTAQDDLGGMYVHGTGPGSSQDGVEELSLEFRPRLHPQARALRLTFTGRSEQVTATVDLSGRQHPRAR